MTPEALLETLRRLDVVVSVVDGTLRVRAPEGTLTPDLKTALAANKADLVQLLGSRTASPIRPTWDGGETPLAPMQERMWYFSRAGLASAYNVVAAYRLLGEFHHAAMKRALDTLVSRHATLRSYVVERDGEPRQRYAPSLEVDLPAEDLSELPPPERMAECRRRMEQDCHRDFDTSVPPLLHFRVFRLSDREHVLFCNIHHGLTDAWSFNVILRELCDAYAAYSVGREPVLPELSVQFPDWILWDLSARDSGPLEAELAYWKQNLAGPLPRFDLPVDRPRTSVFALTGADFPFEIDADLLRRMESVGREDGATPYMVLMAGLHLAIHYLTDARDVIVGTPVSGRSRREITPLIGTFLNTVAVRSSVDPTVTLRHFVREVRGSVLGALAHQTVPFETVVRNLALPRDTARTPVYQVSLSVWDITERPTQWGALRVEPLRVSTPWTHAEFTMWLKSSRGEGLRGWCTYSTDLFDPETAERLAEATRQVIERYVEEPNTLIGDVSLTTAQELTRIGAINQSPGPTPPADTVQGMVSRQALLTPERVAVRDDHVTLTYRELDEASDRIASALTRRGVAAGDLVGLLVEREARMLALFLGVLKAGAACVPVDPTFPTERVRFIVDDARLAALVHTDELDMALPADTLSMTLDELWEERGPSWPRPSVSGDGVAYVFYTSGSTGKPKGVRVSHRNQVNLLTSMLDRLEVTRSDVLVALTTISFDISVLEFYLPLICGAEVVIAPTDATDDPFTLVESLAEWAPTLLQATPSFWRMLLDAGWEGDAGLSVLCGGEALASDLAAELLDRVGALWNVYGPTETTIWSTLHRVRPDDLRLSSVPIGLPVANTQLLVADGRQRPRPIGAAGELLIGGAGVTPGYLDRPELTCERYVDVPGYGRMYRTGDMVRLRQDGVYEYLGRLDAQVKVRGHRIEPGEVESALRTHEHLRDGAVDARAVGEADTRLVAWVVPVKPGVITPSELRAYLRKSLPDYMVPSVIVEMDALPRTPNGKVDRKALPDPLAAGARTEATLRLPETEDERLLASIWSRLLSVEQVGRDDNFFDLGGHSLLSIRVVAEVERETGRRIDPRLLFFYSLEQVASTLATVGRE